MTKRNRNLNKSTFYVNVEELEDAINDSKVKNYVTDELAELFIKIVDGVSHRFPNLAYYNCIEDSKQDALMLLCEKYHMIDTSSGKSCFAYITTIITNSMRQVHGKEKIRKKRKGDMIDKVLDLLNSGNLVYEANLPED